MVPLFPDSPLKVQADFRSHSAAEKLEKITYFYEHEFRQPILQLLENGISRAGQLKDTYEAATDRASRKKYEMLQVLFDGQPEHILEQLMEE